MVVCSPEWLADRVAHIGPVAGAHHLVVNSWDWNEISAFCARRVAAVDGASWRDVAQSLHPFAAWEFDAYDE